MKLLKDILYGARITEVIGSTHIAVENVVADSRHRQALHLLRGHQPAPSWTLTRSIPGAVRAGAAAVVCERMPAEADRSEQVVYMGWSELAVAALGHLAANFYGNPTERLKVVAITGTNGKTTVATLLHRLARIFDRKAGPGQHRRKPHRGQAWSPPPTPPRSRGPALFADMLDAGCTHCFMEASSRLDLKTASPAAS